MTDPSEQVGDGGSHIDVFAPATAIELRRARYDSSWLVAGFPLASIVAAFIVTYQPWATYVRIVAAGALLAFQVLVAVHGLRIMRITRGRVFLLRFTRGSSGYISSVTVNAGVPSRVEAVSEGSRLGVKVAAVNRFRGFPWVPPANDVAVLVEVDGRVAMRAAMGPVRVDLDLALWADEQTRRTGVDFRVVQSVP